MSDALEAQAAGDHALAVGLAECVRDDGAEVEMLEAQTPPGHVGRVPGGEETAASEGYGVFSSEAQSEVHGALTTRRATPCQQAFPDARVRLAAHSDARLAHVCRRAGY